MYSVEFVDPDDGQACLVARVETEPEAHDLLRAQWDRWQALTGRNGFHGSVSELNGKEFIVRTQNKVILYRVERDSQRSASRIGGGE